MVFGRIGVLPFLLGWFALGSVFAESRLDTRPFTQFLHQQWKYEDSLSMSRVNDIEITENGYLWLASYDGIYRFDGVHFEKYSDRNDDRLSRGVHSLLATDDGSLWLGGNGNGIARLKDETFTYWSTKDGLDFTVVPRLFKDLENHIVLPGHFGLKTVQNDKIVPYPMAGIEDIRIREVCFMEDGSAFLCEWEGNLLRWNEGNVESVDFSGFSDGKARALVRGDHGLLWVATDNGEILRRSSDGGLTRFVVPLEGPVDSDWYLQADGDTLLAGYNWGLVRIVGDEIEHIKPDPSYESDVVYGMEIASDGAFYCMGYNSGLHLYATPKLEFLTNMDGLLSSNTNATAIHEDGSVWIGTNKGINVFRDGEIEFFSHEALDGEIVRDLFWDSKGRLWACLKGTAFVCIDGDKYQRWTKEDGFPSNRFRVVAEAQDGTIWIGSQDGLFQMLADGSFKSVDGNEQAQLDFVLSIYCDSKNRMWIGTVGGGLVRIDGDDISEVTRGTEAESAVVFAITECSDGKILAGWTGGMVVVDDTGEVDTLKIWNQENKASIFGINFGANNDVWVTTNRTLYQLDVEQFRRFVNRELETPPPYVQYHRDNAFPSRQLRANARTALDRDGRTWIPLENGVAMASSKDNFHNSIPPKINIYRVEFDNQMVSDFSMNAEQIVVPSTVQSIRFMYTGISHQSLERTKFRIRLKGFEEWLDTTRLAAVYTNLAPKTYQFEIMACNADGVWTSDARMLEVVVLPAFYQTKVFWVLCLLLGVLIVWLIFQSRMAHLKSRSRMLESLVEKRTQEIEANYVQLKHTSSDLVDSVTALTQANENNKRMLSMAAHDLKNAATGVVYASDVFQEHINQLGKMDVKEAVDLINLISESGTLILQTIKGFLEEHELQELTEKMKMEKRNLLDLVHSVVELNSQTALSKGQEIAIQHASGDMECFFDPLQMRMAVDNYVSNAIKYSPFDSNIFVALENVVERGMNCLKLSVIDQGPGLNADDLNGVFRRFTRLSAKPTGGEHSSGVGLSIVKELVEAHEGWVGVDSVLGKGSTFYFYIPCRGELATDESVRV